MRTPESRNLIRASWLLGVTTRVDSDILNIDAELNHKLACYFEFRAIDIQRLFSMHILKQRLVTASKMSRATLKEVEPISPMASSLVPNLGPVVVLGEGQVGCRLVGP